MTDDAGMREELGRLQTMLLQYAHLVLELRQQVPSAHERPELIPAKLDALRSAISVSTPQHRPAMVTLDAGFGQHGPKLATPASMMHTSDAMQAELARLRLQVDELQQEEARQRMEVEGAYDALGPASAEISPGRGRPRLQEGIAGLRCRRFALQEVPALGRPAAPHPPGWLARRPRALLSRPTVPSLRDAALSRASVGGRHAARSAWARRPHRCARRVPA